MTNATKSLLGVTLPSPFRWGIDSNACTKQHRKPETRLLGRLRHGLGVPLLPARFRQDLQRLRPAVQLPPTLQPLRRVAPRRSEAQTAAPGRPDAWRATCCASRSCCCDSCARASWRKPSAARNLDLGATPRCNSGGLDAAASPRTPENGCVSAGFKLFQASRPSDASSTASPFLPKSRRASTTNPRESTWQATPAKRSGKRLSLDPKPTFSCQEPV